ncbi:MAG: ComF family protein [Bacillota bacterium]|nr:ComF family protein [Bacillota bacterium]
MTARKICLICNRQTQSFTYICDSCLELFSPKAERVTRSFTYVDEAYSCFYYGSLLKETIRLFKFAQKRYLAYLFGEILIDKIFSLGLNKKVDLLLPVPIHKNTLAKRGYNQVELIADQICKDTKIKLQTNNLIKIKMTQEQARLDMFARQTNLIDSFQVFQPEKIKDKNILLLDDMITTGSTIEECAKVLKAAGAARVYALSLATSH